MSIKSSIYLYEYRLYPIDGKHNMWCLSSNHQYEFTIIIKNQFNSIYWISNYKLSTFFVTRIWSFTINRIQLSSSLYIYIYVYVCVCLCLSFSLCIYTCLYSMYIYIYMHAYLYIYI